MYQAVFIFGIAEQYEVVEAAAIKWLDGHPESLSARPMHRPYPRVEDLVEVWFRNYLHEHQYVLLKEKPSLFSTQVVIDGRFIDLVDDFTQARLYSLFAPALWPGTHPCFYSWCEMSLNRHDLRLHYRVDP